MDLFPFKISLLGLLQFKGKDFLVLHIWPDGPHYGLTIDKS